MAPLVIPPPLRPGATVRIVAPASPFDRTLALCGIAFLGERYHVEFDWRMFEKDGFLAGSDERRRDELARALAASHVSAVIAARGGYGITRIAQSVDFGVLRRAPKWLVGFSDVTAMHVEAQALGLASLHAHHAAGLGRGDAHARERWLRALEEPLAPRTLRGRASKGGVVRGPLVGGNLTVLFTCAVTGRFKLPPGAILALEDVTEASYRIDRMLSALRLGGHLQGVAGVALGGFTDCPAGVHGVAVDRVLERELEALGVPIVSGLPFGHDLPNEPLLLGAEAELDAEQGCLRLGALD
ncbi:MAG TPA: LD-carboxypeptidase [Polyangiaceae bacterium]|nr:LD-carboxypeptidase [Polyangiaceae bacterium]